MFSHCNRTFKPYETWYLTPNQSFTNRKLELGICPKKECQKEMLSLIETRIADKKTFVQLITSKKQIEKTLKKCKSEIEYKDIDVRKKQKQPYGLLWGTNKEIHNTKGEVIGIRQRGNDYYGNNKEVKYIPLT